MLKIDKKIDLLQDYGFTYITEFRNHRLVSETYAYLNEQGYQLAYVDAETYPKLIIKNYACNKRFVEEVFPRLIKDGIVEYVEER